jgi:hypothetical protein
MAARAHAGSDDIVGRDLALTAGHVAIDLEIESNIAHHFAARPISLAPDVWWGATDKLTVGLVHSNASLDRFAPGGSICLRTDDILYCDSAYKGSGIDARYLVTHRGDALAFAPRARLVARDIDPFKPALMLGALARWHAGRFAITADPYVQLGLLHTELGNRAQLWFPLRFAVQPTCRWEVALSTGWNSEVAVIHDGWHVPVALGIRAAATRSLDIGATLGFPTLLGPQNTPKQRVVFVALTWRD